MCIRDGWTDGPDWGVERFSLVTARTGGHRSELDSHLILRRRGQGHRLVVFQYRFIHVLDIQDPVDPHTLGAPRATLRPRPVCQSPGGDGGTLIGIVMNEDLGSVVSDAKCA